MGGNHPNNQTSEANQWPHHFEMLGQLLFGFIFLIVVAFLYIVRATPARFAREATTPLDVSLPGADPPPFGRRSSFLSPRRITFAASAPSAWRGCEASSP